MARSKLGVSNVITTVILTSVMFIIVLSTSFFANNLLTANIERAQFEQVKNVVLAFDKIVDQVTFKPQSSGYVRSSFSTTIPYFVEGGESLQVWVDQTLAHEVPINKIEVLGGSQVSVAASEDLIGDASLLLTKVSDSLGRVCVYQSEGAWIALDFSRARCIYSGISELFNGTDYETYNMIEVTIIDLTFGVLVVQTEACLTAQNIGVECSQNIFSNDFEIRVKNGETEESISLSDLGGDPAYKTIMNFVVVSVETSVLGGV